MDEWAKKDPIANYEAFLLEKKILSQKAIEKISADIAQEIDSNLELAFTEILNMRK